LESFNQINEAAKGEQLMFWFNTLEPLRLPYYTHEQYLANHVPQPWIGLTCTLVKPRVRVKAIARILGMGVPDDAQPGDLVVGNRGAAAEVRLYERTRVLHLVYVGNVYYDYKYHIGQRIYDRQ
jgi:hypothetical protein